MTTGNSSHVPNDSVFLVFDSKPFKPKNEHPMTSDSLLSSFNDALRYADLADAWDIHYGLKGHWISQCSSLQLPDVVRWERSRAILFLFGVSRDGAPDIDQIEPWTARQLGVDPILSGLPDRIC